MVCIRFPLPPFISSKVSEVIFFMLKTFNQKSRITQIFLQREGVGRRVTEDPKNEVYTTSLTNNI